MKSIESAALDGLICSASGWRKIFLSNKSSCLQDHDTLFLFFAITAFVQGQKTIDTKRFLVSIASDSRKTSPALASLAEYAVQKSGHRSIFLGIVPIPAALAYVRKKADLLIYITASHNPKEYNGIKFCGGDGKILKASLNKNIFEQSLQMLRKSQYNFIELLKDIRKNQPYRNLADMQNAVLPQRTKSLHQCYSKTIEEASLRGLAAAKKIFLHKISTFEKKSGMRPAILWDSNGGARSWKMDTDLLWQYGIGLKKIFTRLGVFVHEIVPEGPSIDKLMQCLLASNRTSSKTSSKTRNKRKSTCFVFAILSDCDGDRGNSILYDFEKNKAITLSAQEVFALVLKIELAWERFVQKGNNDKLGIVVNDASSYRINQIAQEYSAQLFRSEVGEANVLALADLQRKKQYKIPLSGEASNGGVILEPSLVRDPLNTAFSLLKGLLFYTELFPELKQPRRRKNSLISLLASLPAASTTNTELAQAKLQIPALSTEEILLRLCKNITKLFAQARKVLQEHQIHVDSYRILNHYRHRSIEIHTKDFQKFQKHVGGITICFLQHNQCVAMLWLRKSKTEPVLRIIVDVLGTKKESAEKNLLLFWRNYLIDLL